jgi:hypothetical protein
MVFIKPIKDFFNRSNLFVALMVVGFLVTISRSDNEALAQEKTDFFPIPETYKTEGIPQIKNSEVEHLFYDSSAIRSNLIWESDAKNKRLLVTDETNNVYLLSSPLAQPIRLMDKVIPNSVKMRVDGDAFAYTSDHDDADNFKLYLYDFKNKTAKELVSLTGKDESIESFVWSQKGDSLYYTRVDYETKTSKLCRFNFTTEKCFQIELKGNWDVLDSNKETLLLKYWKASSSQNLYLYNTQTGKLTPLDEKGNSRKAFFVGDKVFWTSKVNPIVQTANSLF